MVVGIVVVTISSIVSASAFTAFVTTSSVSIISFLSFGIVVVLSFGGRNFLLPFFENLEILKLALGSGTFGEAGLKPNGSPFNLGLDALGANNGDLLYSFSEVVDGGEDVLGLGLFSPG